MAINFDTALGINPQALVLREKRSEILAANLVNADTPGYKARDLDFQSVLKQTQSSDLQLETTRPNHIAPTVSGLNGNLLYRNPYHPSLDGNTVEAQVEQAKYSENAVQYEASLRFINGSFTDLVTSLKGG